jgi:hypothetical protein
VVEGAILLHQDDDVLDIAEAAVWGSGGGQGPLDQMAA